MNGSFDHFNKTAWTIVAVLMAMSISAVRAQNSSLWKRDLLQRDNRPLTLAETSYIFQLPEEPKRFQINDLIIVEVDIKSEVISKAKMQRKKEADLTAVLKDWIRLDGLALKPSPQSDGDPKITGEIDSEYKAEAKFDTRNRMKFNLAAKILDIRPNGNLVIEAHRTIRNNNEVWEQSLTGVVRPEDIYKGNHVLSESIADLRIHKREQGHVRDGYRRGWILKILDSIKLF